MLPKYYLNLGTKNSLERLTIALSLICSTFTIAVNAEDIAKRPNVVVIVADDLGYGELGCYGGDLSTPYLDAMAKSGVRFTNGYVTAPFCAASRAALLTGRYQTRFGFEFNPIGAQNSDPTIGLPMGEQTIADAMREAGYATALIGKWHLGGTAKFHPQRRGFDEFVGFLHEGHYFVPTPWSGHVTWLRRKALPDGTRGRWSSSPNGRVVWSSHMGSFEPDYDADNPILRSSQPIETSLNLTDLFTKEAESFIERYSSQPFLLCLAYNAVHSPLQAADVYLENFKHIEDIQRRIFAAMLAHLDDGIGRVMNQLEKSGIDDRTLVIFVSDNGGPTRELTSSNRPLRGEKGALLEGGIRVPFLMRWPTGLPTPYVETRAVSSLDIFVTAIQLAGASQPKKLDGINLIPCLTTSKTDAIHQELYWRVGTQSAFRNGDWKIFRPREADAPWELYDLRNDIGEANNLANDQPEKLRELKVAWERMDSEMIEPLWGGKPSSGRKR
ncbi:MAG: sulfatase-like hydrolase/transferase [Pirellulaceae bacterium]|nr:sulfatase-like hydrolase/transferase [Pirellulaceae bacterium]